MIQPLFELGDMIQPLNPYVYVKCMLAYKRLNTIKVPAVTIGDVVGTGLTVVTVVGTGVLAVVGDSVVNVVGVVVVSVQNAK